MRDLRRLADWVVETCLLHGASLYTAFTVAGLMVKDFEEEKPTVTPDPPCSSPEK